MSCIWFYNLNIYKEGKSETWKRTGGGHCPNCSTAKNSLEYYWGGAMSQGVAEAKESPGIIFCFAYH